MRDHTFLLCVVLLSTLQFLCCQSQTPPIPTLPRSFSAEYKISVNVVNGGSPVFQGMYAIDYDGLGGFLYVEDSPDGAVPYSLRTSIIGAPDYEKANSNGYLFLNEGRCWRVGQLGRDAFHYIPLEIPQTADFLGNITIDNDLCSMWKWRASVSNYFELDLELVVRYTDNAPMVFKIYNKFFFTFVLTVENSRVVINPSAEYFKAPSGPCQNHTIDSANSDSFFTRFTSSSEKKMGPLGSLMKFIFNTYTAQSGYLDLLTMNYKPKLVQKPQLRHSAPDPTPPALHQYFSSDYQIGYGTLIEKEGWKPRLGFFRGQAVVDKESGGLYLNIADDQEADVPFSFTTSLIIHPNDDKTVDGFWTLRPNRCWITPYPVANPDFPLQIPPTAKFLGNKVIYGKQATVWEFTGTFEGYDGEIQIAVASDDSTILFINLSPNIDPDLLLGSYVIFANFNASKPDASNYGIPAGQCWDPTKQGPGGK